MLRNGVVGRKPVLVLALLIERGAPIYVGHNKIGIDFHGAPVFGDFLRKGLWPRVKRLEENHDVGRALEPNEEQAILDAAAQNQSRLIYPFLFTLAWTGSEFSVTRFTPLVLH